MPYLPPARIDDFARSILADQLAQNWHDRVEGQINRYRNLERFLDPLEADETAAREVIPWSGFPRIFDAWLSVEEDPDPEEHRRRIDRAHRSAEILDRFSFVKLRDDGNFYRVRADASSGWLLYPEVNGAPSFPDGFSLAERPQDEYLEWFVVRDRATNRITRIDFTAEPPEYWETLAETDPNLAEDLYSEILGVAVPKEDLFFQGDVLCPEIERVGNGFRIAGHTRLFPDDPDYKAGQYNRLNKWNTELGAVHLTQSNNTLFAEINLAARATQRFGIRPDLTSNVDRFALTACGGYGALNRNSDPTIGQSVNTLALSGFRAMVSNPIGLYIGEIDLSGFRNPDGDQIPTAEILTIHRGSFNDVDGLARVLRFSIHPPIGSAYGLETCTLDGYPLVTGGPVARQTTVVIHGIAMPASGSHPVTSCDAKSCPHPTKVPEYFLAVGPNANCPSGTNPVWDEEPVTLAPEELKMMAILSGPPRSSGSRVI